MATASSLDRLLEPVTACFTSQVAQKIVDLRLDPEVAARIETLADKANQGTLTPDEDCEYKDYIDGGDLIALLQVKARRFLAEQGK